MEIIIYMSQKLSPPVTKKDYSKYPFMNMSLIDMPGEDWVPIPGFDDYFYVSQYGRIWALARPIYAIDGHFYYTKERIRKQNLVKSYNSFIKDVTEQLTIHIRYEGNSYRFAVNRLVYEAFIGPIDQEGRKPLVVHEDGDNCNNHYNNLVLMNGTELYRHGLEINRRPLMGPPQKKGKTSVWSEKNSPRPIVQYTLDGKKITEFESIADASKKVNSSRGAIRQILTKKLIQLNGFVYRYKGEEYKGEHAGFSLRKEVSQYAIEGKKLSVFSSVAEAASATGIDADTISKCALKKTKLAGTYVWRYENDNYKGEYNGKVKVAKPVNQYSLDGKVIAHFPSVSQASKKTGFSPASIQDCALKHQKVAHGFVWRYEHEKYNGEYKDYRQGKPVTQYDLAGKKIQTFPTIQSAAQQTGLTPDNIQKNVKGENKTAGGFIWKYATPKEIKNLPAFKGLEYNGNSTSGQAVIKYSTDGRKIETYLSMAEAAKACGISGSGISAVLNVEGRTAGGFVWRTKGNRYYGDIIKNPPSNKAQTVTQYDLTGKKINQFKSTKEAEKKTGVTSSTISAVANGKLKTTGGFIWQYGDAPEKLDLSIHFTSTKEALERASKTVEKYTLEGELLTEYPSIAEAARQEGISKNGISSVLNGKQQSCGGYFWKLKKT